MSWVVKTWQNGETITANFANQQFRDNLNVIKTGVFDDGKVVGASAFARTTTDLVKNNSAALSDIPELTFTCGANETWAVQYHLLMTLPAAADAKIGIVPSPVLASLAYGVIPYDKTSTARFTASQNTSLAWNTIGSFDEPALVSALFRGGLFASTIVIRFAQLTATVADSKVLVGSFRIAKRLL